MGELFWGCRRALYRFLVPRRSAKTEKEGDPFDDLLKGAGAKHAPSVHHPSQRRVVLKISVSVVESHEESASVLLTEQIHFIEQAAICQTDTSGFGIGYAFIHRPDKAVNEEQRVWIRVDAKEAENENDDEDDWENHGYRSLERRERSPSLC